MPIGYSSVKEYEKENTGVKGAKNDAERNREKAWIQPQTGSQFHHTSQ